ncbi:hypothetical protein Bca52824_024016 [Brassica carinata]|uniref:Ubiquinol-cytochrome c chaperone domain-containing protein n=1 Tax=Brassica carinata TaxID=52824 RepID=A0A8X8AT93_BRACI|nr:hypothetical protein Bca52824_024016 [Brassica carinata]
MLPRFGRTVCQISKLPSLTTNLSFFSRYGYTTVAPAEQKDFSRSPVNLDKMFWSNCPNSFKDNFLFLMISFLVMLKLISNMFILKMLLFHSKQSVAIRGANVIYKLIIAQVDTPAIYYVFNLEKTFKITYSLLVFHMWLVLRRLKEEGKDGVDIGQYVYEIYNHNVEVRESKAGVNLLLLTWMKELERIFYGNVVAYDAALLYKSSYGGKASLMQSLTEFDCRNIFSDDGTTPDETDLKAAKA